MQGAPAVARSVLLDVFSIDSSYLVYWQRIRLTNQAVTGKIYCSYSSYIDTFMCCADTLYKYKHTGDFTGLYCQLNTILKKM